MDLGYLVSAGLRQGNVYEGAPEQSTSCRWRNVWKLSSRKAALEQKRYERTTMNQHQLMFKIVIRSMLGKKLLTFPTQRWALLRQVLGERLLSGMSELREVGGPRCILYLQLGLMKSIFLRIMIFHWDNTLHNMLHSQILVPCIFRSVSLRLEDNNALKCSSNIFP